MFKPPYTRSTKITIVAMSVFSFAFSFADAQPIGSQPPIKPTSLSLGLGSNIFVNLESRLFLTSTQSSGISVAQTYPRQNTMTEYASSPLEWRLSPSMTFLSDGFIPLITLDSELSLYQNLARSDNSAAVVQSEKVRMPQNSNLEVTEAYVRILSEHVGAEVGRSRMLFGLGVAANPGTQDPDSIGVENWGHAPQGGDIVDRARILVATNTFLPNADGLKFSAGVESVHRDDRVSREDGDAAEGYFVGAMGSLSSHELSIGLLRRNLKYREGGSSSVFALTGAFESETPFFANAATLTFAGEWNWLMGESTLPEAVFFEEPYQVSAMGGVLKSKLRWGSQLLGFEVGYASGDTNRYDNVQRSYQFDPNYRVGLILFPMLNAIHSSVAINNAGDPTYRAQLPRGVDRTATGGAVENALYLYPTFKRSLNSSTAFALGYLYAWRASPYFDVFRSALNGGVPTSPLGNQNSNSLGQEVNLGISKEISVEDLNARFFLVGGVAWPADSLPNDSARIYASSTRMEVSW